MRIGIVAGEASGDLLAADLIQAIRRKHPDAQFEGIAGPKMIEQGCVAIHPLEKLSVFGLFEVLTFLPELLQIRRDIRNRFVQNPPDIFIGVDAPDFNLKLEEQLKGHGIKTAHYVAPTVWAWRQYRVHQIARAVDLMLCIFPFEEDFFKEFNIHARYIGHPLAETIPFVVDQRAARKTLKINVDGEIIAILPGSRKSEVNALGTAFISAARCCLQHHPGVRFLAPMATEKIRRIFEKQLAEQPELPITLIDGRSDLVFAACDVVMTASGTATLEALLYKRPMAIAYKVSWLTYWVVRLFKLVKISNFAMANLVAGRKVAPEFIQKAVVPERIAQVLMNYLENPEERRGLQAVFLEIHLRLKQNSSEKAADAILQLIGRTPDVPGS